MKVLNLKSIDEASEKDLLKYILSTQLQILRRIDYLELKLQGTENVSRFDGTVKEMVQDIDPLLDRINEYLSMGDEEKGLLKC